jgi:hypothetical protein
MTTVADSSKMYINKMGLNKEDRIPIKNVYVLLKNLCKGISLRISQ